MALDTKESYYVGTDLKFKLEVKGAGFDQAKDDYDVTLVCNGHKETVSNDDIVIGDGNIFLLLVDTTRFGNGMLSAVITAKVPDDDFDVGFRREVDVINLCTIKRTR